MDLHEFLEIHPIKKNPWDKNLHFEVLNKVDLTICPHFVSIVSFKVPTELSENTIGVVYTTLVSILSPTSDQNILKFN